MEKKEITISEVFSKIGVPYENYKTSYRFKDSDLDEQIRMLADIDGLTPSQELNKAIAFYASVRDLRNKGFHIHGFRFGDEVEGVYLCPE